VPLAVKAEKPAQACRASPDFEGDLGTRRRLQSVHGAVTENPKELVQKHNQDMNAPGDDVMISPPVLDIGSLHLYVTTDWGSRRTGSSIVNRRRLWKVDHSPAVAPEPVAPVDVFAIHKEILSEESDAI
jgi:hypothetical protein